MFIIISLQLKLKKEILKNCSKYQNRNHSLIKQKPEIAEKMQIHLKQPFDILLATLIVESGIHLPNANQLLSMGLIDLVFDLHQLRGIGRSNKEGYCYYVVDDKNQ